MTEGGGGGGGGKNCQNIDSVICERPLTGGLSAPVQTRQVDTMKDCPVICIVLMVWIDRLDDEEGR